MSANGERQDMHPKAFIFQLIHHWSTPIK